MLRPLLLATALTASAAFAVGLSDGGSTSAAPTTPTSAPTATPTPAPVAPPSPIAPVVESPVPPPTTPAADPTPAEPAQPGPPSTPPDVVAPTTLRPGDSGPAVSELQDRLRRLGFWLGTPDGQYGEVTQQAVMAFQKIEGLQRDGIAGDATRAALLTASPVQPRSTADVGRIVEIDLARQVLLVVEDGSVRVFNTSTGSGGRWTTPPGRFAVDREIDGIRHAPLGDLYRPKYFNGGIAIHGSPSIPGYPASHGCARLHNAAMDHLWASGDVPVGTPVWVY